MLSCCSITQLCPTLCNPMDCNMPGFTVLHHLPDLAKMHIHWVSDAIQPFHPVIAFPFCLLSFPASGSFPLSQLFASGGQSIGASASASILLINIQSLFPLGLIGLIFFQSKGLTRVLHHHSWKASVLQHSAFFMVQVSYPHRTTGKTRALPVWTFLGKVMSLLFILFIYLYVSAF